MSRAFLDAIDEVIRKLEEEKGARNVEITVTMSESDMYRLLDEPVPELPEYRLSSARLKTRHGWVIVRSREARADCPRCGGD
jgi:hypothetical protein